MTSINGSTIMIENPSETAGTANLIPDDNMRMCVTSSGRERDIDREGDEGEQTTNNIDSNTNEELDIDAHMCRPLSKNISNKTGRVNVWIGKDLKVAAMKAGIHFSSFLRDKLTEYFQEKGIRVNYEIPDLILLVRCPHCGNKQQTASVQMVNCQNCKRSFRIYRKRGSSRILRILRGDRALLQKKYYRIYGR